MVDRVGRWPAAAAGAAGALAGALLGVPLGEPHLIAASALLAGCMAAIALEDARNFRVPDSWNLLAAIGGLAAAWLSANAPDLTEPLTATARAAIQGALCGGAFLLLREGYFRLRKVEGLGLGDVKLAATGGIWLGWEFFAVAVMLAALLSLVWVAGVTAMGGAWPRDRKIPLGAFLAPAIFACWYGARFFPLS